MIFTSEFHWDQQVSYQNLREILDFQTSSCNVIEQNFA